MNDDLTRRLRDAAAAIDDASEAVTADEARRRRSGPAPRSRRLAFVAAAAVIVVGAGGLVALNRDDTASVDILPADTTTTTTTVTSTTTSAPTTTTSTTTPPTTTVDPADVVDVAALPPSGFGVSSLDGRTRLYDLDGTLLAETVTPEGSNNDGWLALDTASGLLVDTERPAALDVPTGCDRAAVGGSARFAICDEQRTIRRYDGDVITMLIPAPAPDPEWTEATTLGRWRWVDARAGSDVLALWGAECEVPFTFRVRDGAILDAPGVPLMSAVLAPGDDWWEAPSTKPVGWHGSDPIVSVQPGLCSDETVPPGVYRIDNGEPILLVPYGDDAAASATWWEKDAVHRGNPLQAVLGRAIAALGLEGCCGEPSHGGQNARMGAVVDGQEIFIWADAHEDAPRAHGRGPRIDDPADGPRTRVAVVLTDDPAGLGHTIVTFSCETTTISLGHGDVETMVDLANDLVPRLGCTLVPPVLVDDPVDDRLEVMAEWLRIHFRPFFFRLWEVEPVVTEQATTGRLDIAIDIDVDVILRTALFDIIAPPDARRYESDGFVAGIGELGDTTVVTFSCDEYVVSFESSGELALVATADHLASIAEGFARAIPCAIGEPVIG